MPGPISRAAAKQAKLELKAAEKAAKDALPKVRRCKLNR